MDSHKYISEIICEWGVPLRVRRAVTQAFPPLTSASNIFRTAYSFLVHFDPIPEEIHQVSNHIADEGTTYSQYAIVGFSASERCTLVNLTTTPILLAAKCMLQQRYESLRSPLSFINQLN